VAGLDTFLSERLAAAGASVRLTDLVLAAATSSDALTAVLAGAPVARPGPHEPTSGGATPGLFLGEVAVTGIRGAGPQATLKLRPRPGLTLVVGRNGSGKSTFSEATELALTGTCSRWHERSSVDWCNGWYNLHFSGTRRVRVVLRDSEGGSTVLLREWDAAARDVADGTLTITGDRTADELAFDDALEEFRPFLSYNELGELLHKRPSELHDAIGRGLGTDDLDDVRDTLRAARLEWQKIGKDFKARTQQLATELEALDDPRARAARAAITQRRPDLDTVRGLLQGGGAEAGTIATLETLATLQIADPGEIEAIVAECTAALDEREAATQGVAQRAEMLCELLTQALAFHDHHPDQRDCPVCGTTGVIDDEWVARTEASVASHAAESRGMREATERVRDVDRRMRELIAAVPVELGRPDAPVAANDARTAWEAWAALRDEPDLATRAKHLEARHRALHDALAIVRDSARAELDRLSAAWAPFVGRLGGWLDDAPVALAAPGLVKEIEQAEQWTRDLVAAVRTERLQPILERVGEVWALLRRDSNVDLGTIELTGSATSRRATIPVAVDGERSVALSVMSQGELHALALSLFLPRATLATSPFRFVMVDDPVQAMDAARVEGLARVLDEIARTRQVIVLTHDERLQRACRNLGVDTRVIEVTRDARSVVTTRARRVPALDLLEDARAFLIDGQLPAEVRARVVPGVCRTAIEASATDLVWRRELRGGAAPEHVEQQLARQLKVKQLLALALFGDAGRAGDVLRTLNDVGRWAGDAVQQSDRGAHGDHETIDLDQLVRNTERLVKHLEGQEPE
jgi:energy-coupling factor transporter ATP-binding protein EcfA2